MKRSERLILCTIFVLAGVVVLYVGVSRLYAGSSSAHVAQRTSAADLAKLRDFTAIEVNGNFSVEVVQDAGYSVALTPPDAGRGDMVAFEAAEPRVDKASMSAGKVDLAGRVTLSVID